MANTNKRTAQSLSKRLEEAHALIDQQGICLTCPDYGIDYFDLRQEFIRTHKCFDSFSKKAKEFNEFAKKRIFERAEKGSPRYWQNKAYCDIVEAKRFAYHYRRYLRVSERSYSSGGFAAVNDSQVERISIHSHAF